MRPFANVCTLLFCAALCACTSNRSDVSIKDSGVFIPSGRLSIDISPKPATASEPHSGHAIEVQATATSGSGAQSLNAGQPPIVFGGQSFSPPQQLKGDFDFKFGALAYRWRRFFSAEAIGIELLGGLGYAGLDLTLASPTQQAKQNLGSAGGVGGFGLIWRMRPGTSVQTRLTVFASGRSDAVNRADSFELFLSQALGRNVAVKAGYTAWEVSLDQTLATAFTNSSEIRVRFSGPALGLELMF